MLLINGQMVLKKVYEYRTTSGYFLGTENHRIVQNGEKNRS